jgi:hypothetical protein
MNDMSLLKFDGASKIQSRVGKYLSNIDANTLWAAVKNKTVDETTLPAIVCAVMRLTKFLKEPGYVKKAVAIAVLNTAIHAHVADETRRRVLFMLLPGLVDMFSDLASGESNIFRDRTKTNTPCCW